MQGPCLLKTTGHMAWPGRKALDSGPRGSKCRDETARARGEGFFPAASKRSGRSMGKEVGPTWDIPRN